MPLLLACPAPGTAVATSPRSILAQTSVLTETEQLYLKNHQPIVFVSQTHYAPFEFIQQDGNRDGMCIELARWIATEFGFKARFVDTDFATAQHMIQSGEADVLTSFFYSEKRDRFFDFTHTLFHIPATIFVPVGRPDIKEVDDLNGKTIAIQKGDYAEEFLNQQGIDFTMLPAANFTEATDQLIAGKADAIIGDEQIVLYHLYTNELQKRLKKIGQPLYVGKNSMAVVEGERILARILNKGIQLAEERGVLESITRKWLGTPLGEAERWWYSYRWPLGSAAAVVTGLLVVIWLWNLTLRRQVRQRTRELRTSEARLHAALEALDEGFVIYDADDRLVMCNEKYRKLYPGIAHLLLPGTPYQEIITNYSHLLFNGTQEQKDWIESLLTRFHDEQSQEVLTPERRWIKWVARKTPDGSTVGLRIDITQLKESAQQLRDALAEKETLLKEVHHRVKNNMQVISSLLDLQSHSINDPAQTTVFQELGNRVRAMALVHENLYRMESFSEISISQYLRKLTNQVTQSLTVPTTSIDFHFDIRDPSISIDDAVPFGLIVTEILTNALKYAFPDQKSGIIEIALHQREDRHELRIKDNGIGLPDSFDPNSAKTLGLRLIRDLTTGQLEGQWQVDGRDGVCWSIVW